MDTDLAYTIIGCAMNVYQKLGPGLLESVYQKALMIELDNACLLCEEEVPINVVYDGNNLGLGFRMDILVEDTIILELKSVSQLEKVHFKQLQTYLRLANKPFGYLINFNTDKFTIGNSIHRIKNLEFLG
ncbi:MAG: GxxExxY protein [Bacteroidales bacterium]|nr:GxxExxY protein [Bacteroidales bacterium]